MKNLTWQQVVVIIGVAVPVVAGVVLLGLAGRDTAALIGLGALIFGGLGLVIGQNAALKDQGNGNTTRLLDMVEQQGKLLAAMRPPPVADQPATVEPDPPE